MDAFQKNVRNATRALLHSPGFTLLAVLTLALGLGASIAIYTILHSIVLSPLPYADAERLVRIENQVPGVDASRSWGLSPAGYFHFHSESRALESIGIYTTGQANLTGDAPAERIRLARTTPSVLSVLRARPLHGRILVEDDDRPANTAPGAVLPGPAEPVALLGHSFWVRRFGSDPAAVGRTLELNGRAVPIVGVLESGFDLPEPGAEVDVWVPMGLNPSAAPTNWHTFAGIARLSADATAAEAEAELKRFTSRFTELYPSAYSESFIEETGFTPKVTPLLEHVVGDLSRTLWILLASVGLVLLIACANVANLFLVRTEGRRREIAIRSAVGARRGDLVRQFLAEGAVLGLISGAAGLLLADLGVRALIWTAPEGLPRVDEITMGGAVLGFAATLSIVTGLALGLLPVLRYANGNSERIVREERRGVTTGHEPGLTRDLLVIVQVAMALVLLAGAGLLLQSFRHLRSVDAGLDPAGVLVMELTLPPTSYPGYQPVAGFYQEYLRRLEALPGVHRAAVTGSLPLASEQLCSSIFLEDQPISGNSEPPCVPTSTVSPGYFETLQIPVKGSIPGWSEVNRASGEVVVSRALAERFWPGEEPIGKGLRGNGWGEPFYRVVGVTDDVRHDGLDKPPSEMIYFPLIPIDGAPLWSPLFGATLVVQSDEGRQESLIGPIRSVTAEMDPQIPIASIRMMNDVVARSTARASYAMLLLGIAAAVALFLSGIGLYGVLAYVVSRRRTEIGIRMALGAPIRQVVGLVVRQCARLTLAGLAIGLVAAVGATRVLRSLLFGVSPTDLATLTVVSLLLLGVGLIASYLPARRAAAVEPAVALRSD